MYIVNNYGDTNKMDNCVYHNKAIFTVCVIYMPCLIRSCICMSR